MLFKINNIFILVVLIATGCQRTLNWDLNARGTLKDAQGICYPSTIHGNFYKGATPQGDSSYIEVKVNVYSPGTYFISSDLQNGLQFASSGSFADTGIHLIKLKPTGAPFIAANSNFKIIFDTSVCSLAISVKDSTDLNDTLNTWRYTSIENNEKYHGIINTTQLLTTPSSKLLSLRHAATNPSDTTFDISIVFPGTIATGSYTTDSLNNFALSYRGICINCAWNVAYRLHGAITTIVVTNYDPQTNIIKGTFSGTTIDSLNNILSVKEGAFYALIK